MRETLKKERSIQIVLKMLIGIGAKDEDGVDLWVRESVFIVDETVGLLLRLYTDALDTHPIDHHDQAHAIYFSTRLAFFPRENKMFIKDKRSTHNIHIGEETEREREYIIA